jgi:hypothetical protein
MSDIPLIPPIHKPINGLHDLVQKTNYLKKSSLIPMINLYGDPFQNGNKPGRNKKSCVIIGAFILCSSWLYQKNK